MALSTSISKALASLCPTVTQTSLTGTQTASMLHCDSDTVTIPKIAYREENGALSQGDLEVSVQSSQYNDTSIRKAMIDSAALTAMQSAMGSNCYSQQFDIIGKRSYIPSIIRRWFAEQPTTHQMTMCMVTSFASVEYLPEYWRQAQDPRDEFMWLTATWDFKVTPSAQFDCQFIAALSDALVLVAPEFAPGEIALGDEIEAVCAEAASYLGH